MTTARRRALLALIAATTTAVSALAGESRLINGKPVEAGTYKEVIRIQSAGAYCTATVVGPKVIITAGHCAENGAVAKFKLGGTEYEAKMTRSPIYPGKDHDVAVGITTTPVSGAEPATIGGKAAVGLGITLLGYGCTNPGGGGGNDGVLRYGDTAITGFSGFDMVSRKAGGAALCFGDSGGPSFLIEAGKKALLGINSKGNIQDTNYNARLDIPESQTWLKDFATQNSVDICGINKNCGGVEPPVKPTCSISAAPNPIKIGNELTITMVSSGQVTAATIDGTTVDFPTGTKKISPQTAGTFTTRGSVTGPGGTNACEATYVVENKPPDPDQPPTCTLVAVPDEIKLGESLTLELRTQGKATSASIDGTSVAFPLGKKIITPSAKGTFSARGVAVGPGGQNTCAASYTVDDDITPPPDTPSLAVVPAYCGDNLIQESKVRRVCLSILKKETQTLSMKFGQVIQVNYSDLTKEVMPIIFRKEKPKQEGDVQVQEDLVLYANNAIPAKDYMVLDTRKATLTSAPVGRDSYIPVAIEGRTVKGAYFLVDKLQAFGVSE